LLRGVFIDVVTPRKAACQEWVDQFNQEVSPWYQRVSDNRESYAFELAPLQSGVPRPPGDWISLPHPSSVGFYIDTLNQYVMPTIDAVIDFSAIDHLVIVSAGEAPFGQAARSTLPDDSVLGSAALRVSEGGEFQMEDMPGVFSWRRQIATVLLGENTATDPNFIQKSSAVLIHEFGHLHGFPDRYETFNMNGSGRDYVTGYSPMGLQWEAQINALSVHFLGFEQHWMGFAQTAAPFLEIPKNTIAQEHDLVYVTTANPPSGSKSVLKIPVEGSGSTFSSFRGYTVEARTRDTSNIFNDHILQQGVVVTWVDPAVENDARHIKVVDDPDNPADLWNAAFEVGDHFEDGGRGVVIDVVPNLGTGYRVRVTNTDPTTLRPDPRITPWTTATWESVDIWIDSPVNGYGVFTSSDGNRDVPGVRSSASDPAIVNRVYYRISNDGVSTAQNLRINISYTAPGIGQTSWILIGSKPIGAILPGQSVTGYTDWVVPDGFANGEPHACVKVEIIADSSDLNTSNNLAQENIFQFETVSSSPWKPRGIRFTVTNPSKDYDARVLLHLSGLPAGWAVRLLPDGFALAPGKSQVVEFVLYPAGGPGSPVPDYTAGYMAQVKVTAQFDLLINGQYRTEVGGGISTRLRLTEGTQTSLSILRSYPGRANLRTCVKGLRGQTVSGARIGIQYWKGSTVKWASGTTDAKGCITTSINELSPGKWQAKSFYSGTGIYGSSRSPTRTFIIG
jgi:M6 family metalloprotease-like protein